MRNQPTLADLLVFLLEDDGFRVIDPNSSKHPEWRAKRAEEKRAREREHQSIKALANTERNRYGD